MKIVIVVGTFFPSSGGVQVKTHNLCNKLYDLNIILEKILRTYESISLKNID